MDRYVGLDSVSFKFLRWLYPIPEKELKRDRPLEVLALGLSRSGTESLQQALIQLGYNECHHGFRFITDPTETLVWVQLHLARRQGKSFTAADFDPILGDCAAVTDVPSYCFAHELIDAYPDAKVILNYREDVEAWHKSVESTLDRHNKDLSLYGWILTLFNPILFWNHHVSIYQNFQEQFGYDFAKNGRRWYEDHYRGLEDHLERDGKQYLEWKVQDGWDPLCEFLEKPVPPTAFPSGNTPKAYEARMAQGYMTVIAQARRNLWLFVGSAVAAIGVMIALYRVS